MAKNVSMINAIILPWDFDSIEETLIRSKRGDLCCLLRKGFVDDFSRRNVGPPILTRLLGPIFFVFALGAVAAFTVRPITVLLGYLGLLVLKFLLVRLAAANSGKRFVTTVLAGCLPAPPRAGDDWKAFVEVMGNLRYSEWPVDLERARLWYEPHLDRIHEDAETRRTDLLQLEQIASGYPSRERFLTELTLDPPDATSDQAGVPLLDEDYLILSTIHSAKGQEWKSVYLLNVVDGCMPSDLGAGTSAEIEEERRLLYVAMTRANDDLHLVVPQRFFVHGQRAQGDRHMYASRTRFIPEKLLDLFERTAWPLVSSAARAASQGPKMDIGARMRDMWQ
jgi:hypothetical protein